MGRVLVGAGGGRARGRRATWTAATWAYRARRAGFFAQRRPGVPGIASATKTRTTLSQHAYTLTNRTQRYWARRAATDPSGLKEARLGRRRRSAHQHPISAHTLTRGHADTPDIRHKQKGRAPARRPHPPPHPCSAQSSAASRTERLPAARGSARPAAARAQMQLGSPCSVVATKISSVSVVALAPSASSCCASFPVARRSEGQAGDARARAVAWRGARQAR